MGIILQLVSVILTLICSNDGAVCIYTSPILVKDLFVSMQCICTSLEWLGQDHLDTDQCPLVRLFIWMQCFFLSNSFVRVWT